MNVQPRVPNPVAGVDVLALPLSTQEGFVLSRVDGSSSVEDICMMVGIGQQELLGILERLAELGAVELSWRPRPQKSPEPEKPRRPSRPPDAHFTRAAPIYDPRELDETSDVPGELRKRILDAYYSLPGRNHYQLLGVAYDADRTVIRARYFELSKVFHPDSLFRKDLGAYRSKMEEVFKRLTEAYETLGKKKRRKEYDEYLSITAQTTEVRETLAAAEQAAETIRRSSMPSVGKVGAQPSRDALRPPPTPAAEAAVASAKVSMRPPVSTAERRARVRKRLRQGLKSSASTRPPPPNGAIPEVEVPRPSKAPDRQSMIDGLRQSIRASAAVTGGNGGASKEAVSDKVRGHMQKAQDAESAGEPMVAVAELQLALAIEPDNEWLQTEHGRLSKAVARALADNYEKQACYEEKTGNWAAAANSWARVADGRPESDEAARYTAEALVKASGDLHKAQKYAQRAVDIDGKSVTNLVCLARVYLAAGLKLNAQRELEKAAKLDPDDEMVKNLIREAR